MLPALALPVHISRLLLISAVFVNALLEDVHCVVVGEAVSHSLRIVDELEVLISLNRYFQLLSDGHPFFIFATMIIVVKF